MNKEAKQQYMQTLRERYYKAAKKEKADLSSRNNCNYQPYYLYVI